MIDKEGRRIVIDASTRPPAPGSGDRIRAVMELGRQLPEIVRAMILTHCGFKAATAAALEHEKTKLHGRALGLTDEQVRAVIVDSDLYDSWEDIRDRLTLLAMEQRP